jgi:hypothetical protein
MEDMIACIGWNAFLIICPLHLSEGCGEYMDLRKITVGCKKLCHKEIHNLYLSPQMLR